MCLAVPGKIISIDETDTSVKMAKVNFGGVVKEVCLDWIENPNIGEYVLVHVGFAINKIDEADAKETIDLLRQMGEIPDDYEPENQTGQNNN